MSPDCDRCGEGARSGDVLPLAQWRESEEERGVGPTLCEECREKLVEWVDRGEGGHCPECGSPVRLGWLSGKRVCFRGHEWREDEP